MVGYRSTASERVSSEVLFHGGLAVNLSRSRPFQLNGRLALQAFGKRLQAVPEIAVVHRRGIILMVINCYEPPLRALGLVHAIPICSVGASRHEP